MTLTELFEYTKEHDVEIDIRCEKHTGFFIITMHKNNIRCSSIIEPDLMAMSFEEYMGYIIASLMDRINNWEEET